MNKYTIIYTDLDGSTSHFHTQSNLLISMFVREIMNDAGFWNGDVWVMPSRIMFIRSDR